MQIAIGFYNFLQFFIQYFVSMIFHFGFFVKSTN